MNNFFSASAKHVLLLAVFWFASNMPAFSQNISSGTINVRNWSMDICGNNNEGSNTNNSHNCPFSNCSNNQAAPELRIRFGARHDSNPFTYSATQVKNNTTGSNTCKWGQGTTQRSEAYGTCTSGGAPTDILAYTFSNYSGNSFTVFHEGWEEDVAPNLEYNSGDESYYTSTNNVSITSWGANQTNTFNFPWHGTGNECNGGSPLVKSEFSITYTYVALNTPPTPPVSGAGPCYTLQSISSDQENVTWYWQTSPTGTSTANAGNNPPNPPANATYYLRARGDRSGQWSTASAGVDVFCGCPNDATDRTYGDMVVGCGVFNEDTLATAYYKRVPVIDKINYTFSTCNGTIFNSTTIPAIQNPRSLTLKQNNNNDQRIAFSAKNGPDCNTDRGSLDWTADFTGNVRAYVNNGVCGQVWQSGSSAVLKVRQNTTVSNTTPSSNLCLDATRTLTYSLSGAHNNPDVSWSIVSGSTAGGNINSGIYTPANPGSVTIRATLGVCISDITFNVITCSPPTITNINPDFACANEGDTVFITGTNFFGVNDVKIGTQSIFYQYVNNSTLVALVPPGAASGNIVVTTGISPAATSAQMFTMYPVPVISTQPISATTCEEGTASFSVSSPTPGALYQWQFFSSGQWYSADLLNSSGFNSNTLNITYALAAYNNGQLRCVVTANGCSSISDIATLTVETKPAIQQHPEDVSLCPDQGVQNLTVSATGVDLTYQWYKNGNPLAEDAIYSGVNVPTLTITEPPIGENGAVLTVLVSGTCNGNPYNVMSAAAILTVDNSAPVPSPVYASNYIVCEGQSINLVGFSPGYDIDFYLQASGGSPVYTSSSGVSTPNFTPTNGQTWYAETRMANTTCISSRVVVGAITVIPDDPNNPQLGYIAPVRVCQPQQVTLNASPCVSGTVNWYDSPNSCVPLHSGSSYTTNVSSTTNFYTNVTGPVISTATYTPNPAIPQGGSDLHGLAGQMFEIEAAPGKTIVIKGLTFQAHNSGDRPIRVYYKNSPLTFPATYPANTINGTASSWIRVHNANINLSNAATGNITFNEGTITVPAGCKVSIYLFYPVKYAFGDASYTRVSNNDLTINGFGLGAAASTTEFSMGASGSRAFRGTLTYDVRLVSPTITVPVVVDGTVKIPDIVGDNSVCKGATIDLDINTAQLPTGGTITSVNGYRIHTFTGNGTFNVPSGIAPLNAEILVVGGGGGGGSNGGGGGGAGGVLYEPSYSLNGSYSVTIGAGGASGSTGEKGGNSILSGATTLTAFGGGGGGHRDSDPPVSGQKNGGSGGGGSGASISSGSCNPGSVSQSVSDCNNTSVNLTINCLPAGSTITGIDLNVSIGTACTNWYRLQYSVNGSSWTTINCSGTYSNLSAWNGLGNGAVIRIRAVDTDSWCDNTTVSINAGTTVYYTGAGDRYLGGTGVAGQGSNGGNGTIPDPGCNAAGGGGGGAGGPGTLASNNIGGNGGPGLPFDISGVPIYYAGGGGGGLTGFVGCGGNNSWAGTNGVGGIGGGGNGESTVGTNGLGGGGGAERNGGSGVVIIRYPDPTSGIWTSTNSSAAAVNSSTGVVTGIENGGADIVYTVTSPAGCVGSKNRNVVVRKIPTVPSVIDDSPVCENIPINIESRGMAPGGQVAIFDATTSVINLGNPSALQITGDQTIEMWINPNSSILRRNPYAKAYAGEGTITLEPSGVLNYFYGNLGNNSGAGGTNYQTVASSTTVPNNQWTHIALVRDLSSPSKTVKWYINGVLTNSVAASFNVAVAGSLNALIGSGYTNNFDGLIDNVRIWNVARTQDQIVQNMNIEAPYSAFGLVAHYALNGDANLTYGSANGGTPTNVMYGLANYYTYTWSGTYTPTPPSSQSETQVIYDALAGNHGISVTASVTGGCNSDAATKIIEVKANNQPASTWNAGSPDDKEDWFDPRNWNNCTPGDQTVVTIPRGHTNYPVVTETSTFDNATVKGKAKAQKVTLQTTGTGNMPTLNINSNTELRVNE